MNRIEFEKGKSQVAIKPKLGTTLVTGHAAKYWEEAADIYAQSLSQIEPNVDTSTCNGCGRVDKIWITIDNWSILDGKQYCRPCQKERKIGWYKSN